MGIGHIKVEAAAAFDAIPVANAQVTILDLDGNVVTVMETDQSGVTDAFLVPAPDAWHTLNPGDPGPFYSLYRVEVTAPGYETVVINGVQVFDGEVSLLPVDMIPASRTGLPRVIDIPPNSLLETEPWNQVGPVDMRVLGRRSVVIPQLITVHLGAPTANIRNVRVSFTDYIKNVASSEIYPTWPEAALEANIYCQISFALNRVFTEWYPSRGYPFHITSSTSYDQSYVDGRNIFENISRIVDRIFNTFVRRVGHAEPYFTQYCNGTTVTCRGLSQWGTVPLANQGLNAYQILRNYYPSDIELTTTNNISGVTESYPGTPLRQGSQGEAVRQMQTYLNRIRVNYPLIPQISPVDGTFGSGTASAVRTFQQIFNLSADGIVGSATWYKIIQIYTSVKKLADLDSEGERIGIGATPPQTVIQQGSRGRDVVQLQYILNYLSQFYSDIPPVVENSQFDTATRASVLAFQRKFGLTADGVVGPVTWQKLYEVYRSAQNTEEPQPPSTGTSYPGTLLRVGSRGESVLLMQRYLNAIFGVCPFAPAPLAEDGIFGSATQAGVVAFQRMSDLSQDGIIGPLTWEAIVDAYQQVTG